MQKAEKRFQSIFQKYANFDKSQYAKLDVSREVFEKPKTKLFLLLFVLIFIAGISQIDINSESSCLIDMPLEASKWFREPESCNICFGVTKVSKVTNITTSDFNKYVLDSKPIVVTDGAQNWAATKTFDFDFFQKLYQNSEESSCQFFPYKTEFRSLRQVFEMDPKRARLEKGTEDWYVGWSNCNDEAGHVLRQHYNVPYFLPNTSENIALNWIFMGGPGQGAHMHVDNVQFPSWQAQLRGKKLWRLAPPPECYFKCQEMEVVVEPGQIIVVDTNRWYHQTTILAGEISITIGSEFD